MRNYTVSFLFDSSMNEVLMLRRAKDPYKGRLNGVGGKIEEGEIIVNSALREIQEETGLTEHQLINFSYMATISFPSNTVLNVFYGVVKDEYKNNFTDSNEGTLEWHPVEGLLDVKNKKVAGEGNIAYFLNYAKLLESGIV